MLKAADYQERLTAVRQLLPAWGVDALLITNEANRRWLSGFTGSNARLLLTAEKAIIATDFRYFEQAKLEAPLFELFAHRRTPESDEKLLILGAVTRLGIEEKHVTLAQMKEWQQLALELEWKPLPQTVESLRVLKSASEREIMRRAAAISDMAMSQVPELAKPGMSEKQLAWELEKVMREAGADDVAFPIIVAAGSNSALPHHHPGERRLEAGDNIIVDLGAKIEGYHSDITRSFFLGNEPTPQFWSIFNLVQEAQKAVFTGLKVGLTLVEVDALARAVIDAGGHGVHFGHGLGHGVGLEIHEDPFLSPRAQPEKQLLAGMNITVEPGIYIPGWGGIRLEDFAYVDPEGLTAVSHCPQSPIIPTR